MLFRSGGKIEAHVYPAFIPDDHPLAKVSGAFNGIYVVGNVFKANQTIRVIDQIGNDIAVLFNTKYLGVIPTYPVHVVQILNIKLQ